jgi:dUTP pyrophosphatase
MPSTNSVPVAIKRLPHGEGLDLPAYATDGAAGMDVLAAEDVSLAPGARHAVATGLAVAIPHGFEIQVRPRSGLINHGAEAFAIQRGDRIAQLVLAPVTQASWLEVESLDETARGEGGFGSTGGFLISAKSEPKG